MSTGGAARNAVMKHVAAAKRVGNISVPNHPMYRRFSVLVIQLENCSQVEAVASRLAILVSSVLASRLISKGDSVATFLGTKLREEDAF